MRVYKRSENIFRFFIASLAIVLFLCGCIPVYSLYYEPQAELGRVKSEGPCSMDIEKTVYIPLSGGVELQMAVLLDRYEGKPTLLDISYWIDPDHSIRLINDTVGIQAGLENPLSEYRIAEIRRYTAPAIYEKISALETMEGIKREDKLDGFGGRTAYNYDLMIPNRPDYLVVLPPSVVIDGNLAEVPKITFTRKKRIHVTGLCQ